MPEITVVITAYNLERYIEGCLDELRGQSFRDFEVLVVDDCSTDRTAELLEAYARGNEMPIRVIAPRENLRAPGKSRNFALNSGLIHGKYVIFLDGDDTIEPCFLEKLHALAQESGADMAICAYDRFEDGTGHVLCREMQGFPPEVAFPVQNDMLAFINTSLWNKLIRTELIGALRIPDFRVGEDAVFCLSLYDRCKKLAFTDQVLIHYRVRAASVISNTTQEDIYSFAGELARLRVDTPHAWMKDTLSVAAFIHIGISMMLRAYGNPQVDMRRMIRWVSAYFDESFDGFRGCPWMGLRPLTAHGVKGMGIWGAKVLYRLRCFRVFLWSYTLLTRVLHIDIKF